MICPRGIFSALCLDFVILNNLVHGDHGESCVALIIYLFIFNSSKYSFEELIYLNMMNLILFGFNKYCIVPTILWRSNSK